jgi:hypothetical protein
LTLQLTVFAGEEEPTLQGMEAMFPFHTAVPVQLVPSIAAKTLDACAFAVQKTVMIVFSSGVASLTLIA